MSISLIEFNKTKQKRQQKPKKKKNNPDTQKYKRFELYLKFRKKNEKTAATQIQFLTEK